MGHVIPVNMKTHASNCLISALIAVGVATMIGCSNLFPTPAENSAAAKEIRKCLADDFARLGYKTAWYDDIVDISVRGNSITMTTDLAAVGEQSNSICAAVVSCLTAITKNPSGLGAIEVYGQGGRLLSHRLGIDGKCS